MQNLTDSIHLMEWNGIVLNLSLQNKVHMRDLVNHQLLHESNFERLSTFVQVVRLPFADHHVEYFIPLLLSCIS